MIVPIEHDIDSHTIRYWAILGVKALRIQAQFYAGHEPEVVSTQYCGFGRFVDTKPYTLVEQQVEIALSDEKPPPTRDELRAIADQYDNQDDIVKALESH